MIYYVPLLMIDNFEYNIIKKFDILLQISAKGDNKKITPRYVSNKLDISELSATKLLAESEKIGLVKLEYSMNCTHCGKIIKTNILNTNNRILCTKCKFNKTIQNIKNIYFYYLVLVK